MACLASHAQDNKTKKWGSDSENEDAGFQSLKSYAMIHESIGGSLRHICLGRALYSAGSSVIPTPPWIPERRTEFIGSVGGQNRNQYLPFAVIYIRQVLNRPVKLENHRRSNNTFYIQVKSLHMLSGSKVAQCTSPGAWESSCAVSCSRAKSGRTIGRRTGRHRHTEWSRQCCLYPSSRQLP